MKRPVRCVESFAVSADGMSPETTNTPARNDMPRLRKTKYEQGCEETDKRLKLQLALLIDIYPRHLSESVTAQVGDPTVLYSELDRFAQRLAADGKRGPGRPRKETPNGQ